MKKKTYLSDSQKTKVEETNKTKNAVDAHKPMYLNLTVNSFDFIFLLLFVYFTIEK